MPICKSCHRSITKFDNDICPYCGCKNPIEEGYKTMDITQSLKTQADVEFPFKSKSRLSVSLLCIFFGIFGAHYFYLGYKGKGFFVLFFDIALISGLGFLLHLWMPYYLSFPIVYALFWVYFIIVGIRLKKQVDLKDKEGVLLR